MNDDLDIHAVLDALDIGPLRHDRKINCPLPNHDDRTASCHVYQDNRWHCFGCGAKGDLIDLVRGVMGCSYGAAVMFLARHADLDPETLPERLRSAAPERREPEYVDLGDRFIRESFLLLGDRGAEARHYIVERWGLDPVAIGHAFDVRAAANAIWIPHRHNATVVGVKVRSLTTGDKVSMKGSRFTGHLYRPWNWKELALSCPVALVVEGEPDTWAAHSVRGQDYDAFGLPSGASTVRQEWFDELYACGYRNLWICTDNDEAGRKARERIEECWYRTKNLGAIAWRHIYVPSAHKDFADAARKGWRP